jgi:acyl carrier protein
MAMKSPTQALVHRLVADHLQTDESSIEDGDRLDERGLDPLDLVLIVLRLENLDRGSGDFPVDALDHAQTIGDLVVLVDIWLQRDTMPIDIGVPHAPVT